MHKATLHTKEYSYTTTSGIHISFRSLTYKELNNIKSKYATKSHTFIIAIVKASLLEDALHLLAYTDIEKLYTRIMDYSSLTNEDIDTVTTAVMISLEESFTDDTFKSCKLCQERHLDDKRNCPYLPTDTHDSAVFYIVNGTKLNKCPMDKVNSQLSSDAFRCYSLFEAGLMPSEGGVYDQTTFFVEMSLLVKGLINERINKEHKNNLRKS